MDTRKAVFGESPPSSSTSAPEIAASEGLSLSPQMSTGEAKDVIPSKKHAWNKPSNGSGLSATTDVGSVMGAVSWPALTRFPATPAASVKPVAEGSSVSEAPAMSQSPQKPQPIVNTTHRQRPSNKRGNNINGGTNFFGSVSSAHNEQSQKDPSHKNNLDSGSRGPASRGQNGIDTPRNQYKRGNGQNPRAENPYRHYGNRGNVRDQYRMHHQHRFGPRNFARPSPPFLSMPRGYGNPMGYPDMGTQVYYVPPAVTDQYPTTGVPFMPLTPPPFMLFPQPDPQLSAMLIRQIEYYFSADNLCKDIFLRKNMDEQGWVSISLIASFKMVKQLTNNIPLILDCLGGSSLLELRGDKIRRRNDWKNWLLPKNLSPSSSNTDIAAMSRIDSLTTQMRGLGLDRSKGTPEEVHHEVPNRSSEASQARFYPGDDKHGGRTAATDKTAFPSQNTRNGEQ